MEFESINSYSDEDTCDNYDFPTFYFSFANKKYYFRSISLEVGSLNFINGPKNSGKSLFIKSLTGLEIPNEKPSNKNFLKYNIIYKPQIISPKFSGTLQQFIQKNSLQNLDYYKNFQSNLQPHLNTLIFDLPEEIKQILSFILFINREGLIYIFDCPPLNPQIKTQFWNILKDFSQNNHKISLVVEEDMEIINEIIDRDNGKVYYIKNFGENEFYGQCE